MSKQADEHRTGGNRLLACLPEDELTAIRPLLEVVEVAAGDVLYRPDQQIPFVHFPITCVVAIAVPVAGRVLAGAGLVGSEGMVCIRAFLGTDSVPFIALVQNPGEVLRLTTENFRTAVPRCPLLSRILGRYADAFLTQVSYAAVCNGVHSTEQRCCRWLLMTHDRAVPNGFTLTHEVLAQMLGVQRTSVTEVARGLKDRGLIRYSRGKIRVVDRDGLAAAACECYAGMRTKFDALPGAPPLTS